MKKLVKIIAMLTIAAVIQIGACKLALNERGYKAIGSERLVFPAILFLEYKVFCKSEETLCSEI